ncbi:hypothetical protein AB3R30_24335 [Leptolyngbyaceae cyanobacterium UHCC 1019]
MKFFALSTLIAISLAFFAPTSVESVTVSPRGVNVRTFGATTVFLTFFGLDDQRPAEALWCGAVNANQSCIPGTVFGRLPIRSNLATRSANNNLTDIMTIPASVARRAYQDALQGNSSEFFYVRRFISRTGEPDEFVAVTCRLAGGGARVPLALTNVRLEFVGNAETKTPANRVVQVVAQGQEPPTLQADIRFNGTGRLKGRWEVVLPGDTLPSRQDLLTEATLPIEQRGLQRRYTLVESFDRFLPPTGQVTLPGPDPAKLPKNTTGLHLILLRIEATSDREGNSFTGAGTVNSGGVAGFPMPVLRYFVSPGAKPAISPSTVMPTLALLQPAPNAQLTSTQPITFRWQSIPSARAYKLEIREQENETPILSAVLNRETTSYTAPPLLQKSPGKSLRWRVLTLSDSGVVILQSNWHPFEL